MNGPEIRKLYGLKPNDDPFILWGIRVEVSEAPDAIAVLRSLRAYADSELERLTKEQETRETAQVPREAAPIRQSHVEAGSLQEKIREGAVGVRVSALMEHPLVDEDVKAKIEAATGSIEVDRDAIKNIVIGESDELSFFQKVKNFFSKLFHRNGSEVEDPFLSAAAIDIIDTLGKETFEPPQAAIQVEAKAIIDIISAEPVSDVPARLDPARRVKPSRAKPSIWTVDGRQKPLEPAIFRNREHDPLGIDTIDDEIRAIIRGEIPCV